MRIVCIPVQDDRGLRAPVAPSLDAAAVLLLVDATTLEFRAVSNEVQRRRARGCDPCAALEDTPVDAAIVAEIEPEVLARLARRNVPVYTGARGTAASAIADFVSGRLRRVPVERER